MIKSGGENVYAVEVKNVIQMIPGIRECQVIGLPDEKMSEIVAVAVVLTEGATLTSEELIQFCGEHLAGYKKPRKVFFLLELPHSGANEVQLAKLKEIITKMDGQ